MTFLILYYLFHVVDYKDNVNNHYHNNFLFFYDMILS